MRSPSFPLARASRFAAVAAVLLLGACAPDREPTSPTDNTPDLARGGEQGPDLRAATAAKEKYVERLLSRGGIEGVGVTLTAAGRPAVAIFTLHSGVGGIPRELDGIPVVVQVSGRVSAILPRAVRAQPGKGPNKGPGPTSRLDRPVPIGVSIGNRGECSAGTLGARVVRGGTTYVLSNNHVLALENDAPLGSDILQPGRYDTNCSSSDADVIANLSDFVEIDFGPQNNNTVDVAIAEVVAGAVGNATLPQGYGEPNKTPVAASLNQAVQKCGRTTGCNKGTVTAVNSTWQIQYSTGVARFSNQVVISGKRGSFSRAGDSGSLIVTDNAAAHPVALLFAGSSTITIGNPIGAALSAMNVSIDGK
jgi:hypothetical protein